MSAPPSSRVGPPEDTPGWNILPIPEEEISQVYILNTENTPPNIHSINFHNSYEELYSRKTEYQGV